MKRDLISMLDVKDDLEEIIDLAIELKRKAKDGESIELLKGKTLGMIFEKSSTRTRVSLLILFFLLTIIFLRAGLFQHEKHT